MRRYKQVHRKEVAFDLKEWAEVERRAAAGKVKTGTYIKKIAVNGEFNYYDIEAAAPLINGMRTINNNINQIAYRANARRGVRESEITDAAALVRKAWELVKNGL